jgi:hypothetical protein
METALFNPNLITKYWKNQIPPSNLTSLFTDEYFAPNDYSLLAKDKNGKYLDSHQSEQCRGEIKVEFLQWKRITQIYDHFNVFENVIDPNDILQGSIGDCYFIAAISALAKYPELVYQLFRTKEKSSSGFYEVVLFIDGEWQIVFIDDYIPCYKNSTSPQYGRSSKRNDVWAIILEKAWAKINGGYLNIVGGYPSEVLTTLTGFPSQIIYKYMISENQNLKDIKSSISDKNVICACTDHDQSMNQKGLVARHAYSVLDVKERIIKGKIICLIRLRNPWGYQCWNGNYSNNSSLWTDETRQLFSFEKPYDDGSFWIPIEDFKLYYGLIEICHFMYNSNILSYRIIGNDLKFPNVFNLSIENDSKVAISLFFRNRLFNRPSISRHAFGCIILANYDDEGNIFEVKGKDIGWDEDVHMIEDLKKGNYVVIIYIAYEAWKDPKPDQVIFRVSSISTFKLYRVGTDNDFIAFKRVVINKLNENHTKLKQNSEFLTKQDMFMNHSNLLFSYIYFSNNSDNYMKIELNCNFNDFLTKEPFKIDRFDNCLFYLNPKSEYIILLHKLKRMSGGFKTKIQSSKVKILPKFTESYGIPKNIDYYLNKNLTSLADSQDFFTFHSLNYNKADFVRQFPIIDLKRIREEERRIKEEILRQEREEKVKLRQEKIAKLKDQGIIVTDEELQKEENEEGREYIVIYQECEGEYIEENCKENLENEASTEETEKPQEITQIKCENGHIMSFMTEKVPFKCVTCQNELFGNFWECPLCKIKQCNKCQPAKMVMDDSKCPSNHPWELLLSKQRGYKRFKCYYCSSNGNSAGFNCKICDINICYQCGPALNNKCCFKNHPLKYVSGANLEFGSYVCSKCGEKYEMSNVWEDAECELTLCMRCKIPDYKQEICPNMHKTMWKNSALRDGEEFDCDACGFPNEEGWNCQECSYNVCKECGPFIPEEIENCPNNHKLLWASKEKTINKSFNCDKCKNKYENTSEWFCTECKYNICTNCRHLKIKNQSKCINNHNLKFINCNDKSKAILCISCDKTFMSAWNCNLCNFNICVNCSIIPDKGYCPNKHSLQFYHDPQGIKVFCDICSSSIISNSSWSCKECHFNVCSVCGPEQLGIIFGHCPQNHNLKVIYLNHSYGFCSKCMSKSSTLWNCSLCEFNVCLQCGPVINISDKTKCPYGENLKWTSRKDRGKEDYFYCSGCRIINFSWSWRCMNCLFNYCIECGPKLNLLKLVCVNEHVLKYLSSYERINITNNSDYYCYYCSICKKSFTGGSWNCPQCKFDLCNSCKICYDDISVEKNMH